jgi:hypothetical protein
MSNDVTTLSETFLKSKEKKSTFQQIPFLRCFNYPYQVTTNPIPSLFQLSI